MNGWQILNQLKDELSNRKWNDNVSAEKVFGNVRIVAAGEERLIQESRFPAVFITVQNADTDEDEPGLITQYYDIKLVNMVEGDSFGENSILGANRLDITKSNGRGLMEMEEELLAVIRLMNETLGIKIISRSRSSTGIDNVLEDGYIISRTYVMTVLCTDTKFYHPCNRFIATPGSGQVAMSWDLPPDRFDRKQIRLRRASGSTPPATVTDGVAVALSGDLATSKTDSGLSSGVYSYSLFAGYDEWITGTAAQWSEKVTRTVTVS